MHRVKSFDAPMDLVPDTEQDALSRIVSDALISLRHQASLSGVFVMEPRISGRRVFREDGELAPGRLHQYDHLPLTGAKAEETSSIIRRLVSGARDKSLAKLNVREIVSIPATFASGSLCGTFHCESLIGTGEIEIEALSAARVLANFIGRQIERDIAGAGADAKAKTLIEQILEEDQFHMVYQPIVRTSDGGVIGHECLSRFNPTPYRPPNEWFDMAKTVGLLEELELAAIHKALKALPLMHGYLSVNISPETILKCDLDKELSGYALERVVLEITEHSAIDNYEEIEQALSKLRAKGLHLAIDDAGSGYASLRHILMLNPDMMKIDQSITRGIDTHAGRQAMAGAFRGFAARIGCALVAEGVETVSEREALEFIGIPHAQGYYFGKPQRLEIRPDSHQNLASA